jgi:hypothetical protein
MRKSKTQYVCATSKELLRPTYYYVTNTGYLIEINELSENRIRQALKLHLSKRKLDIFNLLSIDNKMHCVFCDMHNSTWYPTYIIEGKHITITGIEYHKPINYCFISNNKICDGKQLNPNSAEFVSKTQNMSISDALKYIHDRNSSPFYKENHNSSDDYSEYQRTRLDGKSIKEIEQIRKGVKYNNTLDAYIEKYPVDGYDRWMNIQAKKAITLENLIEKYKDIDEATRRYEDWKSKVSCSLDNFIKRHGDTEGEKRYNAWKQKICSNFTEDSLISKHGEELGREKYLQYINNAINPKNPSFSSVTISDRGDILRSNLERAFYNTAESLGLLDLTEYYVDHHYPSSEYRYDFHFPELNLYIEIAGMTKPQYLKKLELKKELFSPMILYPKDVKIFEKICIDIKQQIEDKRSVQF